jgi:L-asparaginase II
MSSSPSSGSNPVLVEALRGGAVESFHRGALAVVDTEGTLRARLGDVDRLVFPRSAVKALQALPLVAGGAADALGLDDAQLALACASHGGEPQHVATAVSMLAAAGLDDDALECGVHPPSHEPAARALAQAGALPNPLHNNCSGKHAGFACLACALHGGADGLRGFLRGYVQHDHPVMREVGAAIEAATGTRLATAPRGVDGCSIPTYALPLRALALGFARFGTGVGLDADRARAAARLRRAVAAAPFYVAGSGRFDTRVMERFGERVFCKVGAEGVYCATFPALGLGVAIKMDDGNTARAVEVAMAAVIEALLPPADGAEAGFLRGLSDVALRNWNGTEVGRLRAAQALRGL